MSDLSDLTDLSDRDVAILAFERQWWKFPGAKEQAIRDIFDLTVTRYYQILNRLLEDPAAELRDPMLIKRLRRIRDAKASGRRHRSAVGQ